MPKLSSPLPVLRSATALMVVLVVAACGGSAIGPSASLPTGSSGPPTSSPSPSAVPVGAIDHKTGATDVILRYEQGGGFVPMEFSASQAPGFTLYGNGVIVFQQLLATFPEPDSRGIVHIHPWRTAKLDEGQVQELLGFALGAGGLGTARDSYVDNGIADAGNTIFTVRAGGLDKTVVVNALFEEQRPGPDSAARAAFYTVLQRLQDFDRGGTIPSDVYVPERYRGVILERERTEDVKPVDWPWPTIKVADFKPGADGSGGAAFPHRAMTADEIAALNIESTEGGLQGLVLKAPDGKLYTLILRPLLVEEDN